MKLIPILFSTLMVQAILSGNKSMTRRTIKPQPDDSGLHNDTLFPRSLQSDLEGWNGTVDATGESKQFKSPYGQPGDVLWGREKFSKKEDRIIRRANVCSSHDLPDGFKWKPGIHMPFEACRIFLRVKEIRVERLHDISEKDAKSEGITYTRPVTMGWMNYMNPALYFDVDKDYLGTSAAAASFFSLWVSINGEESYNSNPWVWAISFARITNANEIAAIRKQWNVNHA